jgi:hypothetical protein
MNAQAIIQTIKDVVTDSELPIADKREKVSDYGAYIASLNELDQMRVRDALAGNGWTKSAAKELVAACVKSLGAKKVTPVDVDLPDSWPYDTDEGKLCLLSKKIDEDGSVEIKATPIADFTAAITEEGTTEEGIKVYTISGCAVRSGPFTVDIEAELFGDDRRLRSLLEAAAGAKDPVRAGMAKHLGPAIKLMTNGELRQTRRYTRTGWQDGKFLIPGREPDGVSVRLSRKLPYQYVAGGDIGQGIEALDALVNFVGPEIGTIVMAHLFLAPMAHWAGWRNERSGLFIAGRTGTQKSTVAQLAMSIYGYGFMDDANLIKWGEGATRNAVMAYATAAHDLPLLIDNYKPSTGNGSHDFTNLIHNIMEGGDKERLNRAAQLRDTKPIFTWPVFTGEDIPDKDPASIARIIVTYFQKKTDLTLLTFAQGKAEHMPSVGATWLDWLESTEGQTVVAEVAADFDKTRRDWYTKIKELCPSCVNPMRVATNLATNELTWLVLCQHPTLGEWATKHAEAHQRGLQNTVQTMTRLLPQSLEANRFIDALREAIGSGRAIVIREKTIAPETLIDARDKDRVIGWNDGRNGIYLLVDVTMTLLQKGLGLDLGNLSKNTLYDQLDELGMIASKSADGKSTRSIHLGGRQNRVLHLSNIDTEEEVQTPL